MTRILIDAGHGGSTRAGNSSAFGSRGTAGTLEKDVTLDIARHGVARLGGAAALTRTGDVNLSLGARASQAARDGADVFVSIHANYGSPEMSGPETWVHPEADASSHELAGGIQRALDRLSGRYGGSAESRRGMMAVLSPQVLGRRTSACLVEVDYLSNPRSEQRLGDPRQRARIGEVIAEAIREHVAVRRPYAHAATTPAEAAADAFAARTTGSVWHGSLTRAAVASRLRHLVGHPDACDQGALNLCGPAAFFHLWLQRDPVSVVAYAQSLFETGRGPIGTLTIEPGGDLKGQDYGALASAHAPFTPPADWMMLSALRDWENDFADFEGTPSEDVAGITTPAEIKKWMDATGIWRSVDDEGNWVFTKGLAHALALRPGGSTDIIVLINANIISSATGGRKKSILDSFPNHFIQLLSPITRSGSDVTFTYWTWGNAPATVTLNATTFDNNYYGSITGHI
jgi:N-acetylmuramoyl-L-alanine amidase